ncbi:MAG TPA: hypothetical protein VED41_00855, partial [Solirubrobacteraceae bacterium]|nr:hypothetical protein [Solirubrobacteraceae bacterium]
MVGFGELDSPCPVEDDDSDVLEPDELGAEELEELEDGATEDVLVTVVFSLVSGSGVKGLWAAPPRCCEKPPVVSATAFSGVYWLT